MFEKNMLTFNPGWDRHGNETDTLTDVRELRRELKRLGISPVTEADEAGQGPASIMAIDPDGNPVLIVSIDSQSISLTTGYVSYRCLPV